MKDILLFSAYWLLQTMVQVNFHQNFYILFCYCGESLSHNRKSRMNLQIISICFFSDAMNAFFQKVSLCCLLPHYLNLNNLTWVEKAQSTQSNYSRIPQEYKITLRYLGDLNILLRLRFLLGFFCLIGKKLYDAASPVWLYFGKRFATNFFPQRKTEVKIKTNLFSSPKCVCLLLKSAQPKAYKLVSGGRKDHKKKTTWLTFQ